MARLELLIVLIVVAFTIYAFIDCILADSARVRALPKVFWALIIVVLAPFGGILWFALGKERRGSTTAVRPTGRRAPDDDPEFLRSLGAEKLGADDERDARIRELEARLAELDDDHDDPKK